MNVHISGVRDLDGKFSEMAEVKDACEKADVGYPPEVESYFKFSHEDIETLKSEMEEMGLGDACQEVDKDGYDVWEIDLSKLPEGVKKIRVKISY